MEQKQMLQSNSEFAGYKIAGKLSRHHDGEREVYQAVDSEGRSVALTVFDIESSRYSSGGSEREQQPDFIEEVRFYKECAKADGRRKVVGALRHLGCGIDSYGRHRYAWMAQEYIEGESLDSVIRRRGTIPINDAFEVMWRMLFVTHFIARFTRGGGHYNISPENIIVRYDGEELEDVRLVGLRHIGAACCGSSPIGKGEIDNRFRAPETYKHIYSFRSDIYSLGMLFLLMLAGYPEETDAEGFYKALWEKADKNLSNRMRLFLRKATNVSPFGRFATIESFNDFLTKLMDTDLKTTTVAEDDYEDLMTLMGGRPRDSREAFKAKQASVAEKDKFAFSESTQTSALDDVAGMADLKALFRRDFIRIVRNPKVAQAYGIKPSNCTLLYGPQGCGKTLIAEKAAQESGLKYKVVNPSELGSIYVHGSQQKIAELFAEAEKKGPMILIFDEFDAIVPKRDSDLNANQANEVNEMLTQLNNCASRGIYVLATTNRPLLLDPAIMRKGRIDRAVYVALPDKDARAELFRIEIEKRPNLGIDYDLLAKATENYTGSDISFIVEESARLCFEETLDRELGEPLPLSTSRLMDVIKTTHPSVSEAQRKEYQELKAKMEGRLSDHGRNKVGFLL